MSLLGQHSSAHRSSHGLLHLISSPDWFIRKASVDALRAISVLNGAELVQSNKKTILRIRERLQRHRFDRVKQQKFSCFSKDLFLGQTCQRCCSSDD